MKIKKFLSISIILLSLFFVTNSHKAFAAINGVCSTVTKYWCTSGMNPGINQKEYSTYYFWQCEGISGGYTSPGCYLNKVIDGVCDNSAPYACSAGTSIGQGLFGTYPYTYWYCEGSGGGKTDTSCRYDDPTTPVYGECGSSHDSNSCSSGTQIDLTDNHPSSWDWKCKGSDGGTTAICKELIPLPPLPPINGQCNSIAGGGCSTGTISSFSSAPGLADYWFCAGSNGGAWSDMCSYYYPPQVCPPPTSEDKTVSCPSGQTGSITQTRNKGAYPGCSWSGWSETSNTCKTPPTIDCPSPTSEDKTLSCPPGQTGSITQTRNKSAPPSCSWSGWSETSNTCTIPPPQKCTDSSASNYGGTLPCTHPQKCIDTSATNYGGLLPCTYIKINGNCGSLHYNCDAGTPANQTNVSSAWIWSCMGSNGGSFDTCTENKIVTCQPPTSENRTVSCPPGQTGSITQTHSKGAYPGCSWSGWSETSNTCTYVAKKCIDPAANNYNQLGNCNYSSCQDSNANNYLVSLPCSYSAITPTVSLSVSPSTVAPGEHATLSWSSTNATSCTATGPWSNEKSPLGPSSGWTDALTSNTTFIYTCTGNGKTVSDSATVVVGTAPVVKCTEPKDTNYGVDVCSNICKNGGVWPICTPPIKINGVWSIWNPERLNVCGVTGIQTRNCNNPAPSNGGLECLKEDGTRGLTESKSYTNDLALCPLLPDLSVTQGGKNVPDGSIVPYNGKVIVDCSGGENIDLNSCTCLYKDSLGEKECLDFKDCKYISPALKRNTSYTISCKGKDYGEVTATRKVLVAPINPNYIEQ